MDIARLGPVDWLGRRGRCVGGGLDGNWLRGQLAAKVAGRGNGTRCGADAAGERRRVGLEDAAGGVIAGGVGTV